MTQRIFDKDNQKDMADLWDIVPEEVYLIKRGICDSDILLWYRTPGGKTSSDCYHGDFLKINWRGAKEITRPVNYEDMIGCVGWFWDDEQDKEHKRLGILTGMEEGYLCDERVSRWENFSPAKKSEIKFWEDGE